jgi:hypothetical protein
LAGIILKQLKRLGEPRNVAAIVTNNAANIKKARELVQADPLYTHIITLRSDPLPCAIYKSV